MADRLPWQEILERLIAFPTISDRSNLDMIGWIRAYLQRFGVDAVLIHDQDGHKANLIARIGPPCHGGVVLSGHTDVVPVAGQDWSTDPFRLTVRGDRLHGRGTADMKSFVALCLDAVPEFLAADLPVPIHLAFSHDEETGCEGAKYLIPSLLDQGLMPAMAVVGEPTSMRPMDTHKGCAALTTTVRGRAAHSSAPDGTVNAIAVTADIVRYLDRLARAAAQGTDHDPAFDPPHATLNVGRIEGGAAANIVAQDCRILWDHRWLPHQSHQTLVRAFERHITRQILPRHRFWGVEAEVMTTSTGIVPGLQRRNLNPAVDKVINVMGAAEPGSVAFGSEAGLFQEAGIATVLIGPGNIEQAHKPDEFIETEQIHTCKKFLRMLSDSPGIG